MNDMSTNESMSPMQNILFVIVIAITLLPTWVSRGEETPVSVPRAARSVHLFYPAPDAVAFYNELTVEKSAPGTYFMACGFSHGYFGIQDKDTGKIVLFSVWDPTKGNDASAVPSDQRVEVVYRGDDVVIRRFGNEGTGGQCLFNYNWKVGEKCRFLVQAKTSGKKTACAAYLYLPETKQWKHLVTFRTITGGDKLKGLYSFIEDFRRDTKSALETRRAVYGNGWVRGANGEWKSLNRARFTASRSTFEAEKTIDAGVTNRSFFLQTGGDTKTTTQLGTLMILPGTDRTPPADLPAD